jgi:uncharacterized protein YegP (UPF0339 family)
VAAQFQLKQAKNGRHFFNLLADNAEIILTSEMYATKAGARKGIASVQANSTSAHRYDRRTTKRGGLHFVLKAANHRIIGRSEIYNSKAAMEKGIRSVIKNGKTKKVVDRSSREG